MNLQIKTATASDARAARDALAQNMADCVAAGASIGFMASLTLAEAQDWWDKVVAAVAAGDTALLIAYQNGEVAGTAQLGLDGPCNGRHRADVKKVMVAPRFQGQGIAKALMLAVEKEAKARKRILMVLDTVTHSTAWHLYKNLGWIEVGPIPDYALFPDGRFCDTTVFYRRIG